MVLVEAVRAKGPALGLNDDPDFERKVRRHANLAENAGLFLAAIAVLEFIAGQTTYVLAIAILFATARILHAVGFSSLTGSHGVDRTGGKRAFILMRMAGAMGTLLTAFICAGFLVANLV